MQRLRAGFASQHSGGTGAPPEATKSLCQELADTDGVCAGDGLSPRQNIRRKARPGGRIIAADDAPGGGCTVKAAQHHKD
ncbi:hypothetical protein DFP91_3948 [Pseudorhodoplanes sinuspersici]|uniref:Uncharacterized protein n=1 Tax=Pseudorhodoplanes sinuspersici TaxID=1235591 RepID=A0A1W6ZNG7_9HYPH|nr:hypothetical protein CAK95_07065 [Pseudorhodoplanes sinuspersici]RKE69515.1 hypothetical protein DFP91_3948 [Pseudorhodoplanes sinuspersici]